MEKETFINFKITGGIYPGNHRSTSISVNCSNIKEGYEKASVWAKKNFPDWNNIDKLNNGIALVAVNATLPISVLVSRRTTLIRI